MPSIQKFPRVFYGWWIVAACFLFAFYVGGGVFYGFTAIFEPVADEFGWSYAQISVAASLRGLEIGLLAPLIGLLVDRWGPRRLMFAGAILTCLGLMLVSRTTSLGMFYGAFALVAVGMSTSSSTVLMTAVANWFHKKVGMATGITISGFGLGGLLVPVIVRLIDMFQWRTTMLIFGVGALVICLPLSLVVRHKPEPYGYLPDGDVSYPVAPDEAFVSVQMTQDKTGAKQALTSSAFWHLALALICQATALTAVITHVMPYLSSIGIVRATSGMLASAIPVVSIGGRLGFGWLGDRFSKRWITTAGFILTTMGLLCFGYAANAGMWPLVPFLILFSIGYGGVNTMRIALVREYFGRARFGTIHGFMVGIMMLGHIAGAPLAGWVYDNWGSYQGIWFVFAGLTFLASVIIATTPKTRDYDAAA